MVDRDKIVKGLKACSDDTGECRKCPYCHYEGIRCLAALTTDAVELLQHDQETIESLQHTISELTKMITMGRIRLRDMK